MNELNRDKGKPMNSTHLVVNIVHPLVKGKAPVPVNEVKFLDTASKGQILKYIKDSMQEDLDRQVDPEAYKNVPKRTYLALAEPVDKYAEKEPAIELTTLLDWLEARNIELTTKAKHALANEVATLYKQHYQTTPRRITRQSSDGKWNKKVYGFEDEALWIFEKALLTVEYTVKPKK